MAKKKIMLSIFGSQTAPNGEENSVELLTRGTYHRKGNVHYVEYSETDPNTNQQSTTLITLDGPQVSMLRTGPHGSHLILQEGKKYVSSHSTPLGDMRVGIFPVSVSYHFNEEGGGEVALEYETDLAGRRAGLSQFNINFWEAGRGTRP